MELVFIQKRVLFTNQMVELKNMLQYLDSVMVQGYTLQYKDTLCSTRIHFIVRTRIHCILQGFRIHCIVQLYSVWNKDTHMYRTRINFIVQGYTVQNNDLLYTVQYKDTLYSTRIHLYYKDTLQTMIQCIQYSTRIHTYIVQVYTVQYKDTVSVQGQV